MANARSFTRYQKQQGNSCDRPQWLELHGARTLTIDRVTREPKRIRVRRAAVSLTGTIQSPRRRPSTPGLTRRGLTAQALAPELEGPSGLCQAALALHTRAEEDVTAWHRARLYDRAEKKPERVGSASLCSGLDITPGAKKV